MRIIKTRLYAITHNVGLWNNLYVHQHKQHTSDTTTKFREYATLNFSELDI